MTWKAIIHSRDGQHGCRLQAMAEGIRALGGAPLFTEPDSPEGIRLVVAWGGSYVDAAWRGRWRGLGVPVLLMELGYLHRCASRDDPAGYSQLSLDHLGWLPPSVPSSARFAALGLALPAPAKSSLPTPASSLPTARRLLVLGQVPHDAQHQLGDKALSGWLTERAAAFAAQGWQILFRPHPRHSLITLGLPHERRDRGTLTDCFAAADRVLTYNSTAGIEALLAGLPVDCAETAPYHGVHPADFAGMIRYFSRLACAQWTCPELASGEALRVMLSFCGIDPESKIENPKAK